LKNPFLYLGARAWLPCSYEPGNTPRALSHPRAVFGAPAFVAALIICVVLGAVSLFMPPFIDWGAANGFLAWRGTLLGAANSIIYVDPKDIARDTVWFLTVWSPGQYLLPDAISSLGVPSVSQ
jgi:hypothetical protein